MVDQFPLTLDQVNAVVEHLMNDGTRDGLILANDVNVALGASARRRAEPLTNPTDRQQVSALINQKGWDLTAVFGFFWDFVESKPEHMKAFLDFLQQKAL